MTRTEMLRQISAALDGRRLVYFGTRGEDAESVGDLPELAASFSIIAAHRSRPTVESLALEDLTGVRVDLDAHDIDDELHTDAVERLRRMMLRTLSQPTALFTYRPSTFVSAITFARADRCRYLGLFKDHQAAFEHKPWVESEIAKLGLAHIPWTYVADEEQLETLRFLNEGPVMLRRSHTSGGVGLARLDAPDQLASLWPEQEEAFVSVAPYIADAIPLNIAAVVFDDDVVVHPASVQLIGIPSLTSLPFGYCGNDFGVVAELERAMLEAVEAAVGEIGRWLGARGYRGAFGVDFLVTADGVPLFTEVNPRFQGSTHASCQISIERGESCVMLDHLAALLGLSAAERPPLWQQAQAIPEFGHFVVHVGGEAARPIDAPSLADALIREPATSRVDLVLPRAVVANPGATVLRATVRDRLTQTGFDFGELWSTHVRRASPDTPAREDVRGYVA